MDKPNLSPETKKQTMERFSHNNSNVFTMTRAHKRKKENLGYAITRSTSFAFSLIRYPFDRYAAVRCTSFVCATLL